MIKNKTTLLTIDIGSNAMRATFFQKRGQGFVPVLKQRFPLRLGQDVFNQGIIEDQKAEQLYQAFKELWHLCYKHHVEHILAVGTSALREAKNNQSIIHHIEKITGISIKLITGALEAKVIFEAVKKNLSLKKKNIAHIDIGGGSTEIVLAKNEKIQKVLSLPLGSVRLLQNKNLVSIQTQINSVIQQNISLTKSQKIDYLVGTGGNFKSLIKVKNYIFPKSPKKQASIQEIRQVYEILTRIDFYQRHKQFGLKFDRADVIVPATYTVLSLMTQLNIKKLVVVDSSLEDGLLEIFKKDFS